MAHLSSNMHVKISAILFKLEIEAELIMGVYVWLKNKLDIVNIFDTLHVLLEVFACSGD